MLLVQKIVFSSEVLKVLHVITSFNCNYQVTIILYIFNCNLVLTVVKSTCKT